MIKTIMISLLFLMMSFSSFAKEKQIVTLKVKGSIYALTRIENGYQVLFNNKAGVYYLDNKNKNYKSLLSQLKTHYKSQKDIILSVDATSLQIKSN